MRKRIVFGLVASSLLIIVSVIMSIYTYHYYTTNRVGPVGDGQFHYSSILTFIFTFVSGVLFLLGSLIQAYKDKS